MQLVMNYSWEPVEPTTNVLFFVTRLTCNDNSFESLHISSAGADVAGVGRTWITVSL